MNVLDFVFVKNLIPTSVCDDVLNIVSKKDWQKHTWYNKKTGSSVSEETKELDVQPTDQDLQDRLAPFIIEAVRQYNQEFAADGEKTSQLVHQFSPCRFNRYEVGTIMRKHYDHIYSIFDGQRKGIPVLSILGLLNNDFEGGNFLVRDQDFNLKKGDFIIFPSCFMYPHEVQEVTKGTRYSFISWAF